MSIFEKRSTLKIFISKNTKYYSSHLSGAIKPIISSLKSVSWINLFFKRITETSQTICFEIAVLDGKMSMFINTPVSYTDRLLDQLFVSFPYIETEEVADVFRRDYKLPDKIFVYTILFNKNDPKSNIKERESDKIKFASMFYGVLQNFARNKKDITIQYLFSKKHVQIKIVPLNFQDSALVSNILHALSQGFNNFSFKIYKSKQSYKDVFHRKMTGHRNNISSIDDIINFIPFPDPQFEIDFQWALYTKKGYNFGEKTVFDLEIGTTTYREKTMKFGVNHIDRFKHMYVIGKSGTGKSTLLTKFIKQDLNHGYGISVLDPHGELIDDISKILTKEQKKNTILFDGINNQIGLNLFLLAKPDNIHFLASGFISIFLAIFGHSWGPRLEHILRQCLLTLLNYSYKHEPQDLEGIIKLLTDGEYRKKIYHTLDDKRLKDFWVNEFNNLDQKQKNESIGPILNKVGQFLSYDFMYKMLTDKKSTFDAADIMNNSKIFLGNLAKGVLGEDAMRLIGMLFIVQYQINSFTRKKANLSSELAPHFFYIDEFQNFVTENFCSMLSECRKYKLGFILANQYVDQLTPEVRSAIFGNVGNLISFTVSNSDAELLAKEFGNGLTPNDFVSLPRYTIYSKIYWDATSVVVSGKS